MERPLPSEKMEYLHVLNVARGDAVPKTYSSCQLQVSTANYTVVTHFHYV